MAKARAPNVSLTPDDERELLALRDDLERELLLSYESFLFRAGRRVDEGRWRLVKSHENFHFYREVSSSRWRATSDRWRPTALSCERGSFEIGPQAAMAANCTLPLLLGAGTIAGTLHDALYGGFFHDTRSLRARNVYANEGIEDSAVVATLEAPTADDPFRFLGLVWYLKTYPLGGMVSSRDMLMLAGSYETQLSNGERVGVAMYHSVDHRDVPERSDLSILRAEVSFASIYRQIDTHRLDVYFMSFVEPKGSSPESFVVSDAVKSNFGIVKVCEMGLRRKLHYRMRSTERKRLRQNSDAPISAEDLCALCSKKIAGFFSASSSPCQICRKRVCSKCKVTKDIVIGSKRSLTTAKPFDFCLGCALETRGASAVVMAQEELLEGWLDPRTEQMSSSSSSTSYDP